MGLQIAGNVLTTVEPAPKAGATIYLDHTYTYIRAYAGNVKK